MELVRQSTMRGKPQAQPEFLTTINLNQRVPGDHPLRGIKESPPYLNDGRLLTLDDTVEFFNLVLETKLTDQEKKDLVAFLKAL